MLKSLLWHSFVAPTVCSEDAHVRRHVSLLLDCAVFMEMLLQAYGIVICDRILISAEEPQALFRVTLHFLSPCNWLSDCVCCWLTWACGAGDSSSQFWLACWMSIHLNFHDKWESKVLLHATSITHTQSLYTSITIPSTIITCKISVYMLSSEKIKLTRGAWNKRWWTVSQPGSPSLYLSNNYW